MRRNPIYVFKDLDALGISNVPLGSTIQINDADDLTPGSQPLLVQVIAKDGIINGSTIRDFLANTSNYTNASETTEVLSELEKIETGGKQGWRLLGADSNIYGPIGEQSVDLSIAGGNTGFLYGAMGDNSFTSGYNVQATGLYSAALGEGTYARNDSSIALGKFNKAQDTNIILEVGIGSSESARKNALEVTNDGVLISPEATNYMIDSKGDFALTTVGYIKAEDALKISKSGDTMTGSLIIDEANLILRKNQSGYNGDLEVEGLIKIGTSFSGNSAIAFNATGTGTGGQKFYYDNVVGEFRVDTANSEGYRVWHSGNDGFDSGLDADKLDGMQPLELPISTQAQQGLDLKYDKTGGLVTGNVDITGNLNVQTETTLVGDLSLGSVASTVTFKEDVQFNRHTNTDGVATAQGVKLKTDIHGKSNINFTDLDNPTIFPALYWENNDKEFQIDTLAGSGYTLWHAGNFNPDSKLDILGGTITGNLAINGTLITNGASEFRNLVDIRSDLNVLDSATFNGISTFVSNVDVGGTFTVAGTSIFNGVASVNNNLFVTGTTTLGGSVSVAGPSTFTGISTFNSDAVVEGSQHTQGSLLVEGSTEVYGELLVGGSVITGTDSNNNSTVGFTDTVSANTPTFYWDNTYRDFYVDLDSNIAAGGFNIWHAGNFDPNDTSTIPKTFDDLTDTPAAKIADKYIQVSSDGLRLTYVDVPDISAIWGNISGTLSNQTDLFGILESKYDKSGGDINGNVRVTGSSTLDGITTAGSNFIVMGTTTLNGATLVSNSLDVTGATNISNTFGVSGSLTAGNTLTVVGDATLSSDVLVEQDLSVSGSSTFNGSVSFANNLDISQNLTVGLSSTLTGAVQMGNTLTVVGSGTFGGNGSFDGTMDITGDTTIGGKANITGDTTIGGKANISGDTVIGGELDVTGFTEFSNGVSLYGAAGLTVSGSSTFSTDLTVGLDLSVSQNLNISGDLGLPGAGSDFIVGGNSTLNTLLTTGASTLNSLIVSNAADLQGDLNVDGHTTVTTLTASGDVILADTSITDLSVSGASNLDGVVVTLADVHVGTTLNVGSNITVGGTGTFAGTVAANAGLSTTTLDTTGTTTVGGDLIVATGSTSVNDLSVATTLGVTGATVIGNTLDVLGATTIGNTLSVNSNTSVAGDISVTGTITQAGETVATLDNTTGKVRTDLLPALAITNVHVVADIAARDALSIPGDVQEGDVAKVTNSIDDTGVNKPQTYILDGTGTWIDIQETSDVVSVAGHTGVVTLDTDDVAEGSNLYYTETRVDNNFSLKTTADLTEGSNLYFTPARAQAEADAQIASASIGDLGDVDLSGVLPGSALAYTGTSWVAVQGKFTDLFDTPINYTGAAGQFVQVNAGENGLEFNAVDVALNSDIGTTIQGYNADTVVDAAYVHTDTNYTAADKAKLDGIADGADVTGIAAAVADIADPLNTTTVDNANKINELLASLRTAGLLAV